MSRADVLALALIAALVSSAHAGDDPRGTLATQLANEASVIAETLATIEGKLREADAIRTQRLRSAYRVLRAPLHHGANEDDRMAAARRRAAARLLLDRDRGERRLLADEADRLHAAAERTIVATGKLPQLALPDRLAWPARGEIARRFGTIVHERSKTTLSRRGLDLEVEARATVTAPADGLVRYAGPIRGLDQGVIVEHGDTFTVLAKLGELSVPVGARVRTGDRLGRAARQRVYLELRVRLGPGGIPIDPEPLLAAPDDN